MKSVTAVRGGGGGGAGGGGGGECRGYWITNNEEIKITFSFTRKIQTCHVDKRMHTALGHE